MAHPVDRLTPQQHQHWRDQQPESYALAHPAEAEQPELFPAEHEQGELFPSEPRAHEPMRDPN